MEKKKRIILAITGASGAIYGLKMLKALKNLHIEVHLTISPLGSRIMVEETHTQPEEAMAMADYYYQPEALAAPIASGSFHTDGMLVVPCSIKTLSGIANSYGENLVQRAADVCLKEGRPLLLAVRETPLHLGQLRLMTLAAQAGAILFPPIPSFYNKPESLDDLVDATVGRMLARIDIDNKLYQPWGEEPLS
jgi:flavin prenyltransferase